MEKVHKNDTSNTRRRSVRTEGQEIQTPASYGAMQYK
jgi:hypothetical protein